MKKYRLILFATIIIVIAMSALTACSDIGDVKAYINDSSAKDIVIDDENGTISFSLTAETFNLADITFSTGNAAYFSDENLTAPIDGVVSLQDGENRFYISVSVGRKSKTFVVTITKKSQPQGGIDDPGKDPETNPPQTGEPEGNDPDDKPGDEKDPDVNPPDEGDPDDQGDDEEYIPTPPAPSEYDEIADFVREFLGKSRYEYTAEQREALVELYRGLGYESEEMQILTSGLIAVRNMDEDSLENLDDIVAAAKILGNLDVTGLKNIMTTYFEIVEMATDVTWQDWTTEPTDLSDLTSEGNPAYDTLIAEAVNGRARLYKEFISDTESNEFLRNILVIIGNVAELPDGMTEKVKPVSDLIIANDSDDLPETLPQGLVDSVTFIGDCIKTILKDTDIEVLGAGFDRFSTNDYSPLKGVGTLEVILAAGNILSAITQDEAEELYSAAVQTFAGTEEDSAEGMRILAPFIAEKLKPEYINLSEETKDQLCEFIEMTRESCEAALNALTEKNRDQYTAEEVGEALALLQPSDESGELYYSGDLVPIAPSMTDEEIISTISACGRIYLYNADGGYYRELTSEETAQLTVSRGDFTGNGKIELQLDGKVCSVPVYVLGEAELQSEWELIYTVPGYALEKENPAASLNDAFTGISYFKISNGVVTFELELRFADLENFAVINSGFSTGTHTAIAYGDHMIFGRLNYVVRYFVPGDARKLTRIYLQTDDIPVEGDALSGTLLLYYDYSYDGSELDRISVHDEKVGVYGVDIDSLPAGRHIVTIVYHGLTIEAEINVLPKERLENMRVELNQAYCYGDIINESDDLYDVVYVDYTFVYEDSTDMYYGAPVSALNASAIMRNSGYELVVTGTQNGDNMEITVAVYKDDVPATDTNGEEIVYSFTVSIS